MENVEQILKSGATLGVFLESQLEELQKSNFIARENLPNERGIYVIYDKIANPLYVGRTNTLKERISSHVRDSSRRGTATFAFILAKEEYGASDETRAALEDREDFQVIFKEKKRYLREECSFKYLLVDNDILQTVVEPYLAYKLETYPKYNTFENH